MKKFSLLFMAVLTLGVTARAADGDKFTVDNFKYKVLSETDHEVIIVGYETKPTGNLVIPSKVEYNSQLYSVSEIDGTAFQDCTGVTSVTFPNSLTTIGDDAFRSCSGLTSVTFPNSLTEIGNFAFYQCDNLTSVTFPNSLTEMGEWAFADCDVLTSVSFPNSLTTIGNNAFYFCRGLTSVTFHDSLTTIGPAAFEGCGCLTSVSFPSSLTTIGERAFAQCQALMSLTFNSPNENLVIERDAISPYVTTIDFTGEYTINSGVFNTIFESYTKITTLRFYGDYVIGESAFENCNIQILYFYGKSDIGDKAFQNSNAGIIYLANCEGIGEYAFATSKYPYKTFTLWCFNDEPPYVASTNAFSGLPYDNIKDSSLMPSNGSNAFIYVPYNSVDAYKKAYGWERFLASTFFGMGELNNLTFTPSEVHLDLRKSTTISYDADMTDGYAFTETSWISSDESVAVVNSKGTVQAKSSGMAIIYFSYSNNYKLTTATAATLVTVGDVDFSLTVEAKNSSIDVEETTTIATTYGGQGYTVASEKWSTSNAEVATVDENGVVTGVAEGDATITLTVTFDNGISVDRECKITVSKNAGIERIEADSSNAPAEYFNLNGMRVNNDALTPGLYIKRQGSKATKMLVK